MYICNSSGLLTTFGGSQEVVPVGLAAGGGQAHRKHDASRLWRRGIRHLSSSLSYYSTCVSQLFSSPALFLYHSCHWLPEECIGKMPGGVHFGTHTAMRKCSG